MEQWLTTALKAVARYARSYPLRQIALGAALFLPWTAGLHLALVASGSEQTAIALAGGWGIKVTAMGLAFLTANAWIALGSYKASRARHKKRLAAREAASKKLDVEKESWRGVIRGLDDVDKAILRRFVDQRQIQFESNALVRPPDYSPLQRLDSLGILDRWLPYAHLTYEIFDLLLAEPEIVGSARPPTKRIAS